MITKIRVLLVEVHAVLRDGLRRILADYPEFRVVGEAGDGQKALQKCGLHSPDLVLLGLILPKKDGFQVLRNIKRNWPEIKVLVLTMQHSHSSCAAAMAAGADGYCLKDTGRDELLSAMRLVRGGRKYISRQLQPLHWHPLATLKPEGHRAAEPYCIPLSQREKEVLQLVVEGYTNRQIANALYISGPTVGHHCTRIREKLGVHSKHAITAFALRAGLAQ